MNAMDSIFRLAAAGAANVSRLRRADHRAGMLVPVVAALWAAGFPAKAAAAPSASEGPAAYVRWIEATINGLEERLPHITAAAEASARLYCEEDYSIKAEGDPGLCGEALGRSGGIMDMNFTRSRPIVLFFPETPEDLRRGIARPGVPWSRVVFAPWWMVEAARIPPAVTNGIIVTHYAASGGLLECEDGRRLVPVDRAAAAAALWVWTGEFVAACTRLGKMPCMYLGYSVAGGLERAERIRRTGNAKFHPHTPLPLEGGRPGKEYLNSLRRSIAEVWRSERRGISRLATLALDTMDSGRRCYLVRMTHLRSGSTMDRPFEPGYFIHASQGWSVRIPDGGFQPGDLVFCDNFDDVWPLGEEAARIRATGAVIAWSFTGRRTEPGRGPQALGPDELFIDQHWGFGDAVVTVPGYDIRILPTSGVMCESVLRMVEAEMVARTDCRKVSAPPPACKLDAAPAIVPEAAEYAPGRRLKVYRPANATAAETARPAIVLIHGGGWSGGMPSLLEPHARWFAGRGLTAVNIGYRLTSEPGVRVEDCVADAQAAVAWVRARAAGLGIDPDRIAVAGDSAGGHLAACTGLMAPPLARANALILFNPVIDTASPDGWRMDRAYTDEARRAISPAHHVAPGAPPTLILHGEADKITPISLSERFVDAMREAGNQAELVRLENAGHAFVLRGYGTPETIDRALAEMERWLSRLGYLPGTSEPEMTDSAP